MTGMRLTSGGAMKAALNGGVALRAPLSRSEGTTSYPALTGKPSIEGVTLEGDKTFGELGLGDITPQDIDRMLYG